MQPIVAECSTISRKGWVLTISFDAFLAMNFNSLAESFMLSDYRHGLQRASNIIALEGANND
jgi:hypothetical protein